jgi:choline kinase
MAIATPSTPGRPKFRRVSSSRSESQGEDEVLHTDFFLDNRLPMDYFKQDILALIHHLRVRRWKRVEKSMVLDIQVNRISGALTNAIYSVDPPPYLKELIKHSHSAASSKTYHHNVPPRLLLRVYGPQVAHLIDREKELATVSRLSSRNIGPRLLGTFANGRFEQFLHARPLTKEDIRDPEISVLIAKRMRELHDGVVLQEEERTKGPGVWVSIDKWAKRAIEKVNEMKRSRSVESVLQSDWNTFWAMLSKYRGWITEKYGEDRIRKELVFAHNDTQYGNILRLEPPKGSPLLAPRNEHRQLIVIDFEYSGGNTRGYDISNHFCEWMSDYHHVEQPHHIFNHKFPTKQQQLNLIEGYVEHGCDNFDDEERMEQEVNYLLEQSVDWRPAVHAYWCIWGIVQAVLDNDKDLELREQKDVQNGTYRFETSDNTNSPSLLVDEVVEEEFDYVAYATEKAQLFWSDIIELDLLDRADYHGILKPIPH